MKPDFPSDFFIKIKVKDGTEILLRPITPDDDELMLEGFYELSDETRYYRFLTWKQTMSREEVKQYTNIDYENNFALGAVIESGDEDGKIREKGIGVARFIRDPNDPTAAEMAVVVIDEWQGKGCGTQLLLNLIRIAKQKGIQWITGTTLTQNHKIFNVLKKSGYKIYFETSQEVTLFKFKI
ncbi:MAG: GNAT family N-acetyltransferase [Candidatus Helarchaeota archaeon]|nr:GNAT family N-acetyltransferase [Candidatus Helarchaeota archaeon]